MNIPVNLRYTKTHEWLEELPDGLYRVGITDFAQDELGDVVFLNLPMEGDEITAGEAFGDIESVKAVSDLVSPVTGTVAEVNEGLLDEPELVNKDPYGEAWILKVRDVTGFDEMLDAAGYEALIAAEG